MSPAIDLRHIRLVATDVDGTIAGADHKLTDRTMQVLRRVDALGIPVVIITGRTPVGAEQLWREIGLSAPAVSCTGGLIKHPGTGEILLKQAIPRDMAMGLIALGNELDVMTSFWTHDKLFVDNRPRSDLMEIINDTRFIRLPDLSDLAAREDAVKIVFGVDPDRMNDVEQRVRERFGLKISATRGTAEFLDITHRTATKGTALAYLAGRLQIPREAILAIGDGDNDVDMLAFAGLAVTLENGMPPAQGVADVVIGHHDREAVADFLEQLLHQTRVV